MKAVLVLNEKAGTYLASEDDCSAGRLRDVFQAAGIEISVRQATPATLTGILIEGLAQRPDALIIGGGDGTLSTAAARLAGTGIPLGILPLGTHNHFARDLRVPARAGDTATALARGEIREIDLGDVNGRTFINNCSLGSYAEAVRRREALRRDQGHGKPIAMFLASCAVFFELRRRRLTIETPGQTVALRTPLVVVANNRYRGRVLGESLRDRLDEGRLWIYTTRARKRWVFLRMLWQSLTRRIDAADDLETYPVVEATIRPAKGRLPAAIDGEVVELQPPLHFRIRPRALRVIVPAAEGHPG
jgi:diacylglycerol kinase family enzyme